MGNTPADLKVQNRRAVLRQFCDGREHTVADIVEQSGIGKLTVQRAVSFFCEQGILACTGKGESTQRGGKKPERYALSSSKPALHITMWPDRLALTVYLLSGHLDDQRVLHWIIPSTPQEAFQLIHDQAHAFLADQHLSPDDLYAVSLSTAGILDYDRLLLKFSTQSPSWGSDIPLGQPLRDIFGPHPYIFVENSGKCVGRAVSDPDDPARTLVFFTSWGLSAALCQAGHILNGPHSLIGEIGHMVLDPHDTTPCACGGHGCAEQLISLPRLIQDISREAPPPSSPLFNLAPTLVSFDILFAASNQGDAYARSHVSRLATYFAQLLRNTALAFDPDCVIFTGDYAKAGPYFDSVLREALQAFRYYSPTPPLRILYDPRDLLTLDAQGAALAMRRHLLSRPELYVTG